MGIVLGQLSRSSVLFFLIELVNLETKAFTA